MCVSPANSCVEALTHYVAGIQSEEIVKIKWGHEGGLCSNRVRVLLRRDARGLASVCLFLREDMMRMKVSSPSQEGSPHWEMNQP